MAKEKNVTQIHVVQTSKFSRVKELYTQEYIDNCKVFLQRGAILQNNISGAYFLQLKFSNNSDKPLQSLYLKLRLSDDTGEAVGGVIDAAYPDVTCAPGQCFGAKNLIAIPGICSHLHFLEIRTAYSDGTVERFGEEAVRPLSAAVPLKAVIPEQYHSFLDTMDDLWCQPEQVSDTLYRCACGGLVVNAGVCANCGKSLQAAIQDSSVEKIKELYDQNQLRAKKEKWSLVFYIAFPFIAIPILGIILSLFS